MANLTIDMLKDAMRLIGDYKHPCRNTFTEPMFMRKPEFEPIPYRSNYLFGMKVVPSPHVPKRKVYVEPRTDDMRAMVGDLVDRGQAVPQYREVDQVLILGDTMFGTPGVLANIT